MGEKLTEAKRRAIKKYDAANTRQVHLKLNLKTDSDILSMLEGQQNTQGMIKRILRSAMPPKVYPPTRYSDTLFGCAACGHELAPGKPNYCSNCGQPVSWEEIT